MPEWSNGAVSKTVELLVGSGGSNPPLSAKGNEDAAELALAAFLFPFAMPAAGGRGCATAGSKSPGRETVRGRFAPPQAAGDVRPQGANPPGERRFVAALPRRRHQGKCDHLQSVRRL